MKEISVVGTSKTPTINYANGKLSFTGCSVPSDAKKIFKNVLTFFENKNNFPADKYLIEIQFEYCDTASLKWVLTILEEFLKNASSTNIEIRWFYESDDYEMLELGEFVRARLHTKFVLVEVKGE